MTKEERLHKAVVDYLKIKSNVNGEILFNSDMSGVPLTSGNKKNFREIARAKKAASLRGRKGTPDIQIFEPKGKYHGLFIELKADGVKIYKQNGFLRKDPHLQEQYEYIQLLRNRGYYADFAVGFEAAKRIIDYYFSQN